MSLTSTMEQTATIEREPGRIEPRDGFAVLHSYPGAEIERGWLDFLARSSCPAHFACPTFFLEPYFQEKKPFAVLAIENGNVSAVLTGLHEGGSVISGLETRAHIAIDERRNIDRALENLLHGVEQESRGAKLIQIYSWHELQLTAFSQSGFRKREFTGNPVFDLSLGAEALLKKFGKPQRHNVRLAKKNGVEIVEAFAKQQFEEFYAIYQKWSRAKQIPQFPKAVEWSAFENTRRNRTYFLAMHEGRAIAGSIVRFFPGGLVECSRNSSLPEFRNLKPNDLLIAHTIEWACANGFRRLSLGAHHKFLRGFGGEIKGIDRYRADRTLLRRHDLRDFVGDASHRAFYRLSKKNQLRVRKLLGRENPAGW